MVMSSNKRVPEQLVLAEKTQRQPWPGHLETRVIQI